MAAWVNGRPGSSISVYDRGLHYGDGVFETVTCVAGRLRWPERHLQRLRAGCKALRLTAPEDSILLDNLTRAAAGSSDCIVKLLVTRGNAMSRGYRPSGDESCNWIVLRYPWPAGHAAALRVNLSKVRLAENALLAGIKHLNRLEHVLAQASMSGDCDEVLMQDRSDMVVCGSMSNLFLAEDDALITPDLNAGGVAGIMRSLVIDAARNLGISLRIEAVSLPRLLAAPSLLLSNVRMGLVPVGLLAGRQLQTYPRWLELREWIDAHAA